MLFHAFLLSVLLACAVFDASESEHGKIQEFMVSQVQSPRRNSFRSSIKELEMLPDGLKHRLGLVFYDIYNNSVHARVPPQSLPGRGYFFPVYSFLKRVVASSPTKIEDCRLAVVLRDETHSLLLWEFLDVVLPADESNATRFLEREAYFMKWSRILSEAPIIRFSKDIRESGTGYLLERKHILLPDPFMTDQRRWQAVRSEILSNRVLWQKKQSKVFWVGAPSGVSYDFRGTPEELASQMGLMYPRMRLVAMSLISNDRIVAKFNHPLSSNDHAVSFFEKVMRGQPYHLDHKTVSKKHHLAFKYLIAVDGWTSAWERVAWILLSDSVLFLVESPKVQWFSSALKPYVHYIPVASDLSNLEEQITWAKVHDDQVANIARSGQAFAQEYFTDANFVEDALLTVRAYAKSFNTKKIK